MRLLSRESLRAREPVNFGGRAQIGSVALLRLGGIASAFFATVLLFFPLVEGVPRSHDLPDHTATATQVLKGWRAGTLFPRWMPDYNDGLGEPTLVFYPPALYLVAASLALVLGGNPVAGLFAALAVLTAVGALGVVLLLRRVFGTTAAAVGLLAWTILPYHAFELYAAGLYPAFAAGCILPWALRAVADLAGGSASRKRALWTWPLTYALLTLLNLPTAVLTGYLVAGWLIVEVVVTRRWRALRDVALGGAAGALLASVYLVPMIAELPSINIPTSANARYDWNFLLQTRGSWMSPGLKSMFDRMELFTLVAVLLSLAIVAAAWARKQLPADEQTAIRLRLFLTWALLALWLATPSSSIFWRFLPYLKQVNLPWRLLEPAGLTAASLLGVAVGLLIRVHSFPKTFVALSLTSLLALGLLWGIFATSISSLNGKISWAAATDAVPYFSRKEGFFLPRGARPASSLGNVPLIACSRPCEVRVRSWLPERRDIEVVAEAPASLLVRTYFFRGWTARRAEEASVRLPIRAEPATGRIEIAVPAGRTRILLRFETTPPRAIGAFLSLLAFVFWLAGWTRAIRTA